MTGSIRSFALLRMFFRALCIIASVSAEAQAIAADADSAVTEGGAATVTLDMFSGRPNPSWPLSEAATREVFDRLRVLAPMTGDAETFDGLGYRAARVELRQGGETIIITAARGVVTCQRGGQQMRYVDRGRKLELWLVNTGAGHVRPDMLDQLAGEIAKEQH